ncbi:type II secretion system protein [Pseudoalteromonas xiamenensis]
MKHNGFTLIEVTVVMAIAALLVSFVGAYSFKHIERVNRQAEIKQAQQWIEKGLFRSFVQGKSGRFVFANNQGSFQMSDARAKISDEVTPQKNYIPNSKDLDFSELERMTFNYISFPRQEVLVSAQGLPSSATIAVADGDRALVINITARVATDEPSEI